MHYHDFLSLFIELNKMKKLKNPIPDECLSKQYLNRRFHPLIGKRCVQAPLLPRYRSQLYVLRNSLMEIEVGLHKARCRHGYAAEKCRERQNLIPAYGGAGFPS